MPVKKMQGLYEQENAWSKTCKGWQAAFLGRYGILHIDLTRNIGLVQFVLSGGKHVQASRFADEKPGGGTPLWKGRGCSSSRLGV